jgi:predicted ABC-type ATPase
MTQAFTARCTILGGTNGSGKSSFFDRSPHLQASGEFVNADLVARSISPERPESVSGPAGRKVIRRLAELISGLQDFVLETTLSSNQSLNLMRTARDAGYHVGLVFVVLKNVGLNVHRVHERVSRGGHFIPDATIHRRYTRALGNLPEAIRLSHEAAVYDNSSTFPVRLIELSGDNISYNGLDEVDATHCEVAGAVAEALGISTDAVFTAAKP